MRARLVARFIIFELIENPILVARNQPASGPDDPRDLDGDAVITGLDARRAVLLCSEPRCGR